MVGEQRRVAVDIPPGIADGQRIRLTRRGHAGQNGGPPGDLYVVVRVREDERFLRDGEDLVTVIDVRGAAGGARARRCRCRRSTATCRSRSRRARSRARRSSCAGAGCRRSRAGARATCGSSSTSRSRAGSRASSATCSSSFAGDDHGRQHALRRGHAGQAQAGARRVIRLAVRVPRAAAEIVLAELLELVAGRAGGDRRRRGRRRVRALRRAGRAARPAGAARGRGRRARRGLDLRGPRRLGRPLEGVAPAGRRRLALPAPARAPAVGGGAGGRRGDRPRHRPGPGVRHGRAPHDAAVPRAAARARPGRRARGLGLRERRARDRGGEARLRAGAGGRRRARVARGVGGERARSTASSSRCGGSTCGASPRRGRRPCSPTSCARCCSTSARLLERAPERLIVSGLLREEADEVAAAFDDHGLRERDRRCGGEWAAVLLGAGLEARRRRSASAVPGVRLDDGAGAEAPLQPPRRRPRGRRGPRSPSLPSQIRSSGKRIVNVCTERQRGMCSASCSGIASSARGPSCARRGCRPRRRAGRRARSRPGSASSRGQAARDSADAELAATAAAATAAATATATAGAAEPGACTWGRRRRSVARGRRGGGAAAGCCATAGGTAACGGPAGGATAGGAAAGAGARRAPPGWRRRWRWSRKACLSWAISARSAAVGPVAAGGVGRGGGLDGRRRLRRAAGVGARTSAPVMTLTPMTITPMPNAA